MSDNWISLVPEDPWFVPSAANQRQARERFAEIAPQADEIEVTNSEHVVFFDCGANFVGVHCPSCDATIPTSWWEDRMIDDNSGGFKLDAYATPCCGIRCALNELTYEWPQAFGRFALVAMNADVGSLNENLKREFEEILGTKLRIVYQRI